MIANSHTTLVAFCACLLTIVVLAICGAYSAKRGDTASAAVYGSAVTGLIGVIGTFVPKGPPAATTQTGDVNMNGETKS